MAITAQMVKELRDMTGAGMMDCKKVLMEADGDIEKATDLLREKGLAKAAKKAGRIAAMGLVGSAFSQDRKSAAIVEINSETDFVAKNQEFQDFVQDMANLALTCEAQNMEEFMAVDFDGATVQDKLNSLIAKIGENMSLRRFEKIQEPGVVYTGYIHGGGTIGVIVGIKTEATADDCAIVGKDVAMQVASMSPSFLRDTDVDKAYIEHEREVFTQEVLNEGHPEERVPKIVEGKIKKQLKEICLLDQKFVKNSEVNVAQYIQSVATEVGHSMEVVSMVRYEVGEGIEKKEDDFAAEVAAAVGNK